MEESIFNKKKWIKSHLNEILTMKKDGLTHKAIIQSLTADISMPFDLSESLLSRYLKDLTVTEPSAFKENQKLIKKNFRQIDRITAQNNNIQNLKRRLERVIERNMHLEPENEFLKKRIRILENKFLDGEARLKDLRRYNGYNNVHWKVADLEQKNDEMLYRMISLERHCEKIAEPLEQLDEQIKQLTIERDAAISERNTMLTALDTEKSDFESKQRSIEQEKIDYKNQTRDLTNQNTTLQANIKRLQRDLDVLHSELLQTQKKLHIEQNKANDIPVQLLEESNTIQDKLINGLIGFIICLVIVLAFFTLLK
jgi:chromosome segregation ATPase